MSGGFLPGFKFCGNLWKNGEEFWFPYAVYFKWSFGLLIHKNWLLHG
jgi:hypothetical protein